MEFFRPARFVWTIEQFIFSLAQDSSCGNLAGFSPSGKAPAAVAPKRRYGAPLFPGGISNHADVN
jgi:hypothetical protein